MEVDKLLSMEKMTSDFTKVEGEVVPKNQELSPFQMTSLTIAFLLCLFLSLFSLVVSFMPSLSFSLSILLSKN